MLRINPATVCHMMAVLMAANEHLSSDSEMMHPMKGTRYRQFRLKELAKLSCDACEAVSAELEERYPDDIQVAQVPIPMFQKRSSGSSR